MASEQSSEGASAVTASNEPVYVNLEPFNTCFPNATESKLLLSLALVTQYKRYTVAWMQKHFYINWIKETEDNIWRLAFTCKTCPYYKEETSMVRWDKELCIFHPIAGPKCRTNTYNSLLKHVPVCPVPVPSLPSYSTPSRKRKLAEELAAARDATVADDGIDASNHDPGTSTTETEGSSEPVAMAEILSDLGTDFAEVVPDHTWDFDFDLLC